MTRGTTHRLVVTVAVCVLLVAAPIAGTAAASAPEPPAAYYGQVTVNGEPAPAGLAVTAVVDGEVRGTITTDANGTFGGADAFADKLAVNGSSADEGATVTFLVGDVAAGTTTWHSGAHEALSLAVTDADAPTVQADVATSPVPAGVAVEFNANASDDLGVANYTWTFDDGATASGETVAHAFSEPGRHQATVTVTDLAGNTATATVNVSVSATQSGGGGGSPGGGGGQPQTGGGGQTQPGSTGSGVAPSVTVTESGLRVVVADLASNQSADVGIPDVPMASANGVRLRNLSVTVTRPTNVSLDVAANASAPAESGPAGGDAMAYLQVDHAIPDDAFEQARFTFDVTTAALEDAGTSPENVVLYRYHDGEWQRLATTVEGETADGYRFSAVSPGFSVFAVRAGQPDVAVTDAALDTTEVAVDESAGLAVTLENDGSSEGEIELTVTLDGSPVTSRTVTVGPDATRTVTLDVAASAAGDYAVAVQDVDAGPLSVTERATTTASDPQTNDGGQQTTDDADSVTTDVGGGPLQEPGGFTPSAFAALAFVLAAVLVLFALARRRT